MGRPIQGALLLLDWRKYLMLVLFPQVRSFRPVSSPHFTSFVLISPRFYRVLVLIWALLVVQMVGKWGIITINLLQVCI